MVYKGWENNSISEEVIMVKCGKCGHKTILATGMVGEFTPDSEPYESDKIEKIDEDICIDTEVLIGIHWCEKCEEVHSIWIEEPRIEDKEEVR